MRYVSFLNSAGEPSFGRLDGEMIVTLATKDCATLAEAIAQGTLASLSPGATIPLAAATLLPVIPDPGKILCVGLNYATHVKETGREQKAHPAIFTRWADTLVAHGQPLLRPRESTRFDYEGELAIIIGKPGRRIAPADAMAHVAGYSIFQDASVRDQPVSDMIWDIPAIIAYCSTFTTLQSGDVIATGTPGGVGDKREPPLYMKAGDTVEIEIGQVGTLSNPVADEG